MADNALKQFFLNGGMNPPGSKYFTLNKPYPEQDKQSTVKKATVKSVKKNPRPVLRGRRKKSIKASRNDIL